MTTRVLFRLREGTPVSETDLRQRLDVLGIPYSETSDEGPIVLGETGITISLTRSEDDSPVEAEVEIPVSNAKQVAGIFNAFRDMGWSS